MLGSSTMRVLFTPNILLTILFVSRTWQSSEAQTMKDALKLREFLLDGDYNKDVRPNYDQNEPVKLWMDFYMTGMGGLDEKDQTMETVIALNIFWRNDFMKWNETDFNGTSSVLIKQQQVWVPDIIVDNSADQFIEFGHKNLYTDVRSCGSLHWSFKMKIVTNCDIDVTYFPFDSQKCDIDLKPQFLCDWELRVFIYNSNKTDAILIDLSTLNEDSIWRIIDSKAYDIKVGESCKQTVRYTFLLQRQRTYYVLSLILPVLFLSFTATLVFAMPVDSGEKMGTVITVLLAYAVYLTIVTDALPQTSVTVSLLGLYLVLLFGLCTICVVLTAVVIHIHHNPEDHRIGKLTQMFARWAKRMGYTYNIFRLIFCCCRSCNESRTNKDSPHQIHSSNDRKDNMNTMTDPPKHVEQTQDNPETNEEEEVTWPDVARAVDWVSFVSTTLANAGATACFACVLTLGSAANQPQLDSQSFSDDVDFYKQGYDDYWSGCDGPLFNV